MSNTASLSEESPTDTSPAETATTTRVQTATTDTFRAQTEPLAALVAVAAVCLAVSVYTGFLTAVLSTTGTDRKVTNATAERVWAELGEDGVYDVPTTNATAIDAESLPQGRSVAVKISYVGSDGYLDTVANVTLDSAGEPIDARPPATAHRVERPISVRVDHGDVRPGTLTVVVWG